MTLSASTAPGSHAVQIYDNEQLVQHAIAEFFTQGTRPGDPLILVSRVRTFEGVAKHLSSGGHGSDDDIARRILFYDAEAVLPEVMDGESLNLARAEHLLGQVVSQSCASRPHGEVRLYGEMVDILSQRGLHSASLQLEGLANSLFNQQPRLSILCGYATERFKDDTNAARLRAVCEKHTHVMPAESFTNVRQEGVLEGQPSSLTRTSGGITRALPIYLVDDDPSIRRSLQRLLISYGWPVRTYDSAEAFLAQRDELSSGCLIVDIGLQGISGLDLVRGLVEARSPWPIIVMSGLYDKKAESEALRLGARAYLRKPFDSQVLINAITRALS